jgi:hypothetical protein
MRLVGRWLPGVDQTPIGAAISTSAAESTAWLKSPFCYAAERESVERLSAREGDAHTAALLLVSRSRNVAQQNCLGHGRPMLLAERGAARGGRPLLDPAGQLAARAASITPVPMRWLETPASP